MRNTLIATTAIILTAILAALVYLNRNPDFQNISDTQTILNEIHNLDADWSLNVLKSKNELNKSYDALSLPVDHLHEVRGTLEELVANIKAPAVHTAMQDVFSVLQEKRDLIDRFKSQDSVLKNSLRYLPTAQTELETAIASLPGTPLLRTLNDSSRGLVFSLLRYNASDDSALLAPIKKDLATLRAMLGSLPDTVKTHAELVLTHAQAILANKKPNDEVLLQITTLPTTQRLDNVNLELSRALEVKRAQSQVWRNILMVYAAFLLALLGYLGYKLLQSYRALRKANSSLALMNATLEQRVEERTHELSRALENLKESQLQLVQAEKMSSLGEMVAGVAHEINTPLAYIRSSLEVVQSRVGDVGSLVECSTAVTQAMNDENTKQEDLVQHFADMEEIASAFHETQAVEEMEQLVNDGIHGIDEISRIVINLKDFSRLDRARISTYNINEGIRNTLSIAKNIVKNRKVITELGELPLIECNPSQINQVLLNLIKNAAHATTAEHGEITITTKPQRNGILILLQDNGTGIAADKEEQIFEPFFTTKPHGQGTGLGLSISKRIIDEHAGVIRCVSRENIGTTFLIYLPVKLKETNPNPQTAAHEA